MVLGSARFFFLNFLSLHAIPPWLSNLMVKFLWWPYHVQYVAELFLLMNVALYHSSFILDVIHATVWDQSETLSMPKKLALYYMCHITLISKLKGNPLKTFGYVVMINRHLEDADGCRKYLFFCTIWYAQKRDSSSLLHKFINKWLAWLCRELPCIAATATCLTDTMLCKSVRSPCCVYMLHNFLLAVTIFY